MTPPLAFRVDRRILALACLAAGCRPAWIAETAPSVLAAAAPDPAARIAPIAESPTTPLAATLVEIGHELAELDVIRRDLDAEPSHPGYTPSERRALGRIEELRAQAMLQARGSSGPVKEPSPWAFARIAEALAIEAGGQFQRLIHPELGLFVVHNVAGSVHHLDRVITWPRGDYDYSTHLDDETALKKLARASRWKPGGKPRSFEDDLGCHRDSDGFARARDTVFDSWSVVVLGMEWEPVPDRYRIEPWEAFSVGNPGVQEDLDEAEFRHMQRAALAVSHYVMLDDIRLDFGRIDGRWYLLAIDITMEHCG